MRADHQLPLHEEVLLLALRDEQGTTDAGSMYSYAVGGALLAELLLHDRVALEQVRRSVLVTVKPATQIGDPILDEALHRVRTASRRASARTWVSRFGQLRLKVRIAERLRQKGILRLDEGRVLWIFTRDVYPQLDPNPERRIIERLRPVFLTDAPPADDRTAILASLAAAASLLGPVLSSAERKERKARIRQVARGQVGGAAATAASEAVQAAISAAATVVMIST